MQLASASSERLMLRPSRSRSPVLAVLYARSEPARSMSDSRDVCFLACAPLSGYFSSATQLTCSTACERDETSLQLVASVVR